MLEIKNLEVSTEEKILLKGLSLKILLGEIHAIMGPNGAGKSTLAKVLAGHPAYTVTKGEVFFKGQDILQLQPDERAHLGLFVSFQYPIEIPGVSNFEFLFSAHKALSKEPFNEEDFRTYVEKVAQSMQIKSDFLDRDINSGFSGGEKKRNEILQMAVLNPSLSILDETDSGLDIDALKIVSDGVNRQMRNDNGLLLITHYQRLLDYIKPHFVHVLMDGKIVKSGGSSLAKDLEEKGYEWISKPA